MARHGTLACSSVTSHSALPRAFMIVSSSGTQHIAIAHAVLVLQKTRILGQLRPAGYLAELGVLVVVATARIR